MGARAERFGHKIDWRWVRGVNITERICTRMYFSTSSLRFTWSSAVTQQTSSVAGVSVALVIAQPVIFHAFDQSKPHDYAKPRLYYASLSLRVLGSFPIFIDRGRLPGFGHIEALDESPSVFIILNISNSNSENPR